MNVDRSDPADDAYGHDFSDRIRRVLRSSDPARWPDFTALASSLNMSESTLRRRLLAEGQSYQCIKDELRSDRAIAMLRESTESVESIALQLGYAEPSAFHRAFRKWTGTRPGSYRSASH